MEEQPINTTHTKMWCNVDIDNKREVKKTVLDVLKTLENAMNCYNGQKQLKNSVEFSMKQVENMKMSEITADKTAFPNDISRKAELSKRLQADDNYQTLSKEATDLEEDLKQWEATITLCKQGLYAFDIITR